MRFVFYDGYMLHKKIRWRKSFSDLPQRILYNYFIFCIKQILLFSSKYQQSNAAIYIFTIKALFNYSASFPYIFLSTSKVPSISKNETGSAIAIVLTNPAIMYATNDTPATVNAYGN